MRLKKILLLLKKQFNLYSLRKFIYKLSYYSIIISLIFLIFFLLNYYRHWSSVLDQEFTLIYNSLLLNSGIKAEFFWHPGHSVILFTSLWLDFLNLINIIEVSDFTSVKEDPKSIKELVFFGRFINLFILICFTFLITRILRKISSNKLFIFLFILIFLVSGSVLFSTSQVRTEFLSALMIYATFYCLICFIRTSKSHRKYIILSSIFFVISIFSKFQSVFIFIFFPFLLLMLCKRKEINFSIFDFEKKNFFNWSILIFFIPIVIIWLKYSSGINYLFVPISLIYLIFFIKFFTYFYNSKNSYFLKFLFYFLLGASIGSILLFILKPFNTNNINVILNSFGMTSMFVQGTNPYEFSFINLKNLFLQSFVGFFDYLNMLYNDFKVETFLFISSILLSFFTFFKKEKNNFLFLFIVTLILFLIIFLFSSRPVPQYTIYFFPIIIIYAFYVFTKINNTMVSYFFISMILILGLVEANSFIKARMFHDKMNIVCSSENIKSKYTYMRQWHNEIDENFLLSVCKE